MGCLPTPHHEPSFDAVLGSTHIPAIDEDARFTGLVEHQSRFVFRVAYAVLLHAQDAEDAVQETFLKLYRHRGWQQAENERAYLARVAWRVAIDLRASRQLRTEPVEDEAEDSAHAAASQDPSPEHSATIGERHALVHALINALPEELRVPLVLSAVEELNSRQIAEILSIPEGTVRTRLQRARLSLRQKLAALEESRYA